MDNSNFFYCVVRGCLNNKTSENVKFFDLPNEEKRRSQWLEVVKRSDLINNPELDYRNFKICSLHFEKSELDSLCRRTPIPNIIPSLQIPATSEPGPSTSKSDSETFKKPITSLIRRRSDVTVRNPPTVMVQPLRRETRPSSIQRLNFMDDPQPSTSKCPYPYRPSQTSTQTISCTELIARIRKVSAPEFQLHSSASAQANPHLVELLTRPPLTFPSDISTKRKPPSESQESESKKKLASEQGDEQTEQLEDNTSTPSTESADDSDEDIAITTEYLSKKEGRS